jgi:FkbM family methyltransferase
MWTLGHAAELSRGSRVSSGASRARHKTLALRRKRHQKAASACRGRPAAAARLRLVTGFYDALTGSARINRLVHRHQLLLRTLEQLPVWVRFPDGTRRIAPFRLLRLVRTWAPYAEEMRASSALYRGGDIVDVGAFHGLYSALLGHAAAPRDRFVSLEPDREAFPELLRNLAACSSVFPHVEMLPLPLAVGDGRPATVTYPEHSGHPRFESSGAADGERASTVDGLVEELRLDPTFVKVDVEGAERLVLEGMRTTLERCRPALMLELHPLWQPQGVTLEAVEALVRDFGYRRVLRLPSDLAIREWWKPVG